MRDQKQNKHGEKHGEKDEETLEVGTAPSLQNVQLPPKEKAVRPPTEQHDTEDKRARDREDARNGRRSDDRRKERVKRAACNTLEKSGLRSTALCLACHLCVRVPRVLSDTSE